MPFLSSPNALFSFSAKKRLGLPNLCGWAFCSWSECGDDNEFAGVYQQRRSRNWDGVDGFIIGKEPKNFFQMPAWPTNTITPARTIVRNKFRNGVNSWKLLTNEQKKSYNERADKKGRKGFCLYQSEFLKS